MRKYLNKLILFYLIGLLLSACTGSQPEEGWVRRYSFSIPSATFGPTVLKEVDELSIETFRLEEFTFLIIDAPSNLDFNGMMKILEKNQPKLFSALSESSPLDRIYKLDQKKEYAAEEGQLIELQENSKRYVLTLEMINDPELREEYKKVHGMGMAWPEITQNMKQVGVKDMEIYLDGYRTYLVMDTKKDFDFAKDGEKWSKLPRESEWQEFVGKFQKIDPKSKTTEKWKKMNQLGFYEENWESLKNYQIPQWIEDAKFGIFIHWGPNAVAELYTDWYPRWMYLDSGNFNPQTGQKIDNKAHPAFAYHKEKFGDQKEFGYKDLIPMFTMENFNPKEWVELFKKAGAQYVVPVAEHHDGFALYESSITPYHAVAMGPKRNVFKELTDEIKKQGLISGASSHLAFNWDFYNQQDYFDTGDPKYMDLYAPPHKKGEPASEEWLANVWWPRTKEIIDNYQPDILWFDFYLDRPEFAPYHKKLAAYFYNSGLKRGKDVVLQTKNYKYKSYMEGTHMLDLERSKMDSIRKESWQTDTSIGKNSWYYAKNWIPKSSGDLIADLVDVVSKNGCLLLNIGPKKDGTIPEDQQKTLLDIGKWLDINGEAIYGAKYWEVYGEGPTKTNTGHLSETKNKRFTSKDIRFTKKGDLLYAFALVPPKEKVAINYLNTDNISIDSITLLGYEGKINFTQSDEQLTIQIPEDINLEYTLTFKITSKK
ncbi:alpha-L-fucosidase [Flexithrix dorotheae]|uniref:alpha-L-fucosidase n=1 Tax=Flexithrix dorotheae TaxID=70993 RepID=UPI0003646B2D|nr:alpha-L-fucosidase [Flexithrix dorotheae]